MCGRVLAALIGCTTDSLPPLGSYFDFMDRLWTAPKSDRYSRTMTRSTLANIEAGARNIRAHDLKLMKKILNADYEDFFKD